MRCVTADGSFDVLQMIKLKTVCRVINFFLTFEQSKKAALGQIFDEDDILANLLLK